MPSLIAPTLSPVQRFEDNNGNPLSGGKLFTYLGGTTTKTSSFTDATGATPNTNPILLNSRGEANVWLQPGVYKFVLSPNTDSDPPSNPFYTIDDIPAIAPALAPVSAAAYGAKFDGINDNSAAINAALAANAVVGIPPGSTAFVSSTIVIPANSSLVTYGFVGTGFFNGIAATAGTQIVGALSLSPVVQLNGGAGYGSPSLQGITVTRNPGTIPTGSVGVQVINANQPLIRDVMSTNHDIGYQWSATGNLSVFGTMDRAMTGTITGVHLDIDGWPGIYASNCYFGGRGIGSACAAYVQIRGGNTPNTPNTFTFVECQFNQGSGAVVQAFMALKSLTAGTFVNEIKIIGCHCEQALAGITTDATITKLTNWYISDSVFLSSNSSSSAANFLQLNAATSTIQDFHVADCQIAFFDFSIAPSLALNAVFVHDCYFPTTTVNVTGPSGQGFVMFTNNTYGRGLSTAGQLLGAIFSGNIIGGSYQNTSSTMFEVDIPGAEVSQVWTPALQFGGNAAGITYTTQVGQYLVYGGIVIASFVITLTSKGSNTGVATIGGLPSQPKNSAGSSVEFFANLASLTGAPIISPTTAAATITLYQAGAAAATQLTDANFTDTSQIQGTVIYFY